MGGPDKVIIRARSGKRLAAEPRLRKAMERRIFDIGTLTLLLFPATEGEGFLDNRAKGIVVHFLADQLRRVDGACLGSVIMPLLIMPIAGTIAFLH